MARLECTRADAPCVCFDLREGQPLLVGRGEEAGARLDGEAYLSRVHVELRLTGGRLGVRKQARASNPVFHEGVAKDEFRLEPGQFFVIGSTKFRFIGDASPMGAAVDAPPAEKRVMESAEVYSVSDRLRLKDLLELPEILRAKDRGDFYVHIARMIRMATGAGWAVVLSGDRRVLGQDSARDDAQIGISGTLCALAGQNAPRPVFHSWRGPAGGIEATSFEGADWAVCAGADLPGGEKILLYAAGTGGSVSPLDRSNLDMTRYVGLVADMVARSLSVRRLEEWGARLGHFFSRRVVDQLLASRDEESLAPRLADATALFFDLRGFSRLAESGGDILRFQARLRAIMTAMTEEILLREGVVLQYLGDGILACWNLPQPQADHVDRACLAALAMRRRLAEIEPDLGCGIGLHTGRLVAGAIGSDQIFSYGVIGSVVNQASRIEGITKAVQAPVLATSEVVARLSAESGVAATILGAFRPAGMKTALELHELREGPRDEARAAAFAAAAAALREGRWADGAAALRARPEQDGPARYLADFCERCLRVPPPDWKGVIELREK